jgi:sugar lactone lactonase YvrE
MRFALVLALAAAPAQARGQREPTHGFALFQPAAGGAVPARAVPAYATSSRIAALEGGALVIDADSGWLIRTDLAGAPLAHLAIGIDAGTLAYDPAAHRAYVADRRGDRIVVVKVGAELELATAWATPAEPYGVALTPDRKTLLVTAIADRAVIALDVATGKEKWRAPVDPEPRGISIAADGAHAAIGSLEVGAIDQVDLASHKIARLAVQTFDQPDAPEHARGAFAVQYFGDHLIAAAVQLELPVAARPEVADHYGGGEEAPILPALAFVDDRGKIATATTEAKEARALAWDAAHDTLYVAGLASDTLIQIVHGSQVDVAAGLTGSLGTRCGADGLAIDGDQVLVWCSFSRAVVRVTPSETKLDAKVGPELVTSNLDAQQHLGMVMFHTSDGNISQMGLSCGTCHLDGRADGESWLIHHQRLQTPMLAGRLVGTAPFKWDGGAKDLPASLRATVTRLGGDGLSKKHLAALVAYLEALPAVRAPSRDKTAVARGKALFESADLGCTWCHDGAAYTDRLTHKFNGRSVDTPSLLGLAASAPYFHDGSAPTLDTLLRDHGAVHGMAGAETGKLSEAQLGDLRAFLETL